MAGLSSYARKSRSKAQGYTSNRPAFRRHSLFGESASATITTLGLFAISPRDAQCARGLKGLVAGAPESDVRCGLSGADPVAKEDGRPGCFVRPGAATDHFVQPGFRTL